MEDQENSLLVDQNGKSKNPYLIAKNLQVDLTMAGMVVDHFSCTKMTLMEESVGDNLNCILIKLQKYAMEH